MKMTRREKQELRLKQIAAERETNKKVMKRLGKRSIWQLIALILVAFAFFGGIGFLARGAEGIVFVSILFVGLAVFSCMLIFLMFGVDKWRNSLIEKRWQKRRDKWKKQHEKKN